MTRKAEPRDPAKPVLLALSWFGGPRPGSRRATEGAVSDLPALVDAASPLVHAGVAPYRMVYRGQNS